MHHNASEVSPFPANARLQSPDVLHSQGEFNRPEHVSDSRIQQTIADIVKEFDFDKVLSRTQSVRAVDLLKSFLPERKIAQYQVLELLDEHLRRALNPRHPAETLELSRLNWTMANMGKDALVLMDSLQSFQEIEYQFAKANPDGDPRMGKEAEKDTERYQARRYLNRRLFSVVKPGGLSSAEEGVLYPASFDVAALRRGTITPQGIQDMTAKWDKELQCKQIFELTGDGMSALQEMNDRVKAWIVANITPTEEALS